MTESLRKQQVNLRKNLVSLSKFTFFFADILSGRRQSDPRYPIRLLYNAFWAIKSFNVHLQLCPDIMHNWSLGNVLHVIDAIVWEQSTFKFLQSFTVHRAAQGGAAQETQVIPDAAIVRLYTITMKATLESYTNDTTHIRLTDRARRRMGRVAETLLQKNLKKKPSNLRLRAERTGYSRRS